MSDIRKALEAAQDKLSELKYGNKEAWDLIKSLRKELAHWQNQSTRLSQEGGEMAARCGSAEARVEKLKAKLGKLMGEE